MARIAFKPAAPTPELASARLRAFLPCQYLADAGWDCEIFDAARFDQYEIVVFQKAYQHEDLDLVAQLRRRGARTVFDLCDNHFYDPEARPILQERAERLRRMIDLVDMVTVSTPILAQLIDRHAVVIDDVLEPVHCDATAPIRRWWRQVSGAPLRVVWFGGAGLEYPPFGLVDLQRIVPELNVAHARTPIRLTVISNSREIFARIATKCDFPIIYREYRTATFQRLFQRQDLCLVPVNVNPFTICKTLNRPALSLTLGLPVIADAIPAYEELRPFITFGDWTDNILDCANHRSAWYRQALAGAAYLNGKFTRRHVVKQWGSVLKRLVSVQAA